MYYYQDENVTVRPMEAEDCAALFRGFAEQGWDKPLSLFERYWEEQGQGRRKVLIAAWRGEPAGYATLLPQASAGPFAGKGWPEVCDFNVLEKYQRRGVGNKILQAAEDLAAQSGDRICLGVGLHAGYGAAQRLYGKRGYVPDGSGVWYRDRLQEPYGPCAADDDLVLYLSKKVARREFRPLKPEELAPELFRYFDRFQVVEQCWRKVQGRWVVKDVPFTERWSDGDYRELCALLRLTLATGGRVWGAFLDGKLKGFASVEGERIGSKGQYADLSSLHVSADARGQGLGRRLFQLAEEDARRLGAGALYISAHSSVESQAFYRSVGCEEAREYQAFHVEKEPCDCQLERPV